MKLYLQKIVLTLHKTARNKEFKNLFALVLGIAALFATTLLLDVPWVQQHAIRQILVYTIMAGEAFILWANIKTINK